MDRMSFDSRKLTTLEKQTFDQHRRTGANPWDALHRATGLRKALTLAGIDGLAAAIELFEKNTIENVPELAEHFELAEEEVRTQIDEVELRLLTEQHRLALEAIQNAQRGISDAAQLLCPIHGLASEWSAISSLYDKTKETWHLVEKARGKIMTEQQVRAYDAETSGSESQN